MITSLKFNNCFAFNKPVEINLKSDMRTKRFSSNLININESLNILKTVAIYGPNNTGKTTLIRCIESIKDTLLNEKIDLESNIFLKNSICELCISFVHNSMEYQYEYKYDDKNKLYIYERMCKINRDLYGNESEELIFLKDTAKEKYKCPNDKNLEKVLNISSNNNILIYTVQTEKFKILEDVKTILTEFANNIYIIRMNRVDSSKTIEILKNNDTRTRKVVEFIKNADLYLNDYKYVEDIEVPEKQKEKLGKKNSELLKLVSVYNGKGVPSIFYDSLGTIKVAALASYIIEAIEEGKVLVIDELDSSLHFKITRAIMSMFNNDLNKKAQLMATLHDVCLLDCKKMFRKEQIWFTDKDQDGVDLYSLKEFSYAENGVRDTSDIKEKYSKGVFGAIPEPDLISSLLEDDNEKM